MIVLEEAVLVLGGWKNRRLRVVFKGMGIMHLSATCSLNDIADTGASFVSGADLGFATDFRGCTAEFADPPETEREEVESALFLRRDDFFLVVMLLAETN